MKSAVEPLTKETKYKKTKDKEEENRKSGSDENNPDADDFSLFVDDDERMIGSDYHVLEVYTQKKLRTNGYLIKLGGMD